MQLVPLHSGDTPADLAARVGDQDVVRLLRGVNGGGGGGAA
jgi:hypothetical protein